MGPQHRLRHRREFVRFFDQGDVLRLRLIQVYRLVNDLGHFRLGITLKARGSSVERNRVKRTVREIFRNLSDVLGSFDYHVVIPKTQRLGYPFSEQLREKLMSEDLTDSGKWTPNVKRK